MIKNLKIKMFISLFVLVTVFSVTSSCFASSITETTAVCTPPFTLDDIFSKVSNLGLNKDNADVVASRNTYSDGSVSYNIFIIPKSAGVSYLKETSLNGYNLLFYDSSGSNIYAENVNFNYNSSKGFYMYSLDDSAYIYDNFPYSSNNKQLLFFNSTATSAFCDISTLPIINYNGGVAYEPNLLKVNVNHEFQNDTSAKVSFSIENAPDGAILKYSLTGVELNTDLTAPLELKNPVIYSPGVTNLIVKPNTKVYWALYDSSGEVLETDVYQVPEYDVVVENADKSIEYSVSYNEDYTLATLNVNVVNGEFSDKLYYTENGMVSNDYAGKQLFPASKSLQIDHNCNMHIILYDPFDNLITAKYVTINKIGLIPEENFKVDVTTGDKTVYVRPRLYNVLQSNFYNIEYDVKLDSWTASQDIKLFQNGVFVSNVTESTSSYSCGSDSELKFYQNIGTSNITVTFRIINAETGFTCLTRTVSFKIGLDNDSTGVTDSTTNGITDNSFITGNGESNYSGVANMGIDDYYNLVNTNNTAWSFFKIILNSLPNWITLPLSLLIFGVVIITLYRFIRGA